MAAPRPADQAAPPAHVAGSDEGVRTEPPKATVRRAVAARPNSRPASDLARLDAEPGALTGWRAAASSGIVVGAVRFVLGRPGSAAKRDADRQARSDRPRRRAPGTRSCRAGQ